MQVTAVGFEPTQLALVELESTPLDHSGKLSWTLCMATNLILEKAPRLEVHSNIPGKVEF